MAIATFFEATGVDRTRYQHTDHLGSLTALTDEDGRIVAQMGFDAWGQRRAGEDWNTFWQQWAMGITPAWALTAIDITSRGFTGHEHVGSMGVIHMNGRIYDAHLGRFLLADLEAQGVTFTREGDSVTVSGLTMDACFVIGSNGTGAICWRSWASLSGPSPSIWPNWCVGPKSWLHRRGGRLAGYYFIRAHPQPAKFTDWPQIPGPTSRQEKRQPRYPLSCRFY